jgi:hypothetical protein
MLCPQIIYKTQSYFRFPSLALKAAEDKQVSGLRRDETASAAQAGVRCQKTETFCSLSSVICFLCSVLCFFLTPESRRGGNT